MNGTTNAERDEEQSKMQDDSISTEKSNGATASPLSNGVDPRAIINSKNLLSSSSLPLPEHDNFKGSPLTEANRSSSFASTTSVPTPTIVVPKRKSTGGLFTNTPPPPPETMHRAVHKIKLSALCHNYQVVESAANRQRCNVIVVVKADGYGHGAIMSALYLADRVGADSFAVATLDEGIALRKAFLGEKPQQQQQPQRSSKPNGNGASTVATLFEVKSNESLSSGGNNSGTSSGLTPTGNMTTYNNNNSNNIRSRRPPHIRILVLGPPVGFPRCFDDYFHYNIEVMVSGPEVARSLMEWVADKAERYRTQVERAARDAQAEALQLAATSRDETTSSSELPDVKFRPPSATLGNVSGRDLAKEIRAMLINQQTAAVVANHQQQKKTQPRASDSTTVATAVESMTTTTTSTIAPPKTQTFLGIEQVAKHSRTRHRVATTATQVFHDNGDDDDDEGNDDGSDEKKNDKQRTPPIVAAAVTTTTTTTTTTVAPLVPRKRLRWHALVDSGMGRLGFRTDPVSKEDQGVRRDSVEIIKELVSFELESADCPIEFFGMCTHMADAGSATSNYTQSQMGRFKSLLKRVRDAGIAVPTVSTDNSAALLTTSFNHFNPDELGVGADTRGYVRCGGAIYGQRPSFPQLRPISTLIASVRHVAILRRGESVGYDRAYVVTDHAAVRIATLTIGFADGYPRELGNGVGRVSIRGRTYPIAGNVCMDMLMVELGAVPEGQSMTENNDQEDVVVGDTAILWGPEEDDNTGGLVPLQQLSSKLQTTQSALTCGLDPMRVKREYG